MGGLWYTCGLPSGAHYMNTEASVPTAQQDNFEAWFLSSASADPMPLDTMLEALADRTASGDAAQLDSWTELMEESLTEQGRSDDVLRVLRFRAGFHKDNPAFKAYCEKKLAALARNDNGRKALIANAGFDKPVALAECFRRLEFLIRMAPGLFCVDKTWGFGVIRNVDPFYGRVVVDFTRKRGHDMSMAYAAEVLQVVGDEHLLARRHRDAAGLNSLIKDNPGEVVKVALRSFGPLTSPRLQEILETEGLVGAGAWKGFWDVARKALKSDPLVIVPSKRNEPLQLLERERVIDESWFAALGGERTVDGVFGRLDELEGSMTPAELPAVGRHAVGERLAFILRGFGDRDPAVRARVLMSARYWQVDAAQIDVVAATAPLRASDVFLEATQSLSTKRLDGLLRFLLEQDRAATVQLLLSTLPSMVLNVLNVCMEFLLAEGEEGPLVAVFRDLVGMRKAGVEVLFWLAKRPERLEAWQLGTTGDLAFQILQALEKSYMGERLRAANQLGELVQGREWLEAASAAMTDVQRTSFVRMLKAAMGRVPVDTPTMIGRLVMAHPELARLMEDRTVTEADSRVKGGFTSWRSYRQRQQQLQKLVNEDIPKNSRDIAVARSYGDLRENFEYKTAKEQQGILLRRQAETEADLQEIKGTDFSGFPSDVAGIGTRVSLRHADGRTQAFYILGEWDQDAEMRIISCSSRMGKMLSGHKAGESVAVPGDQGDEVVTLAEVSGLPEAIVVWAKGVA